MVGLFPVTATAAATAFTEMPADGGPRPPRAILRVGKRALSRVRARALVHVKARNYVCRSTGMEHVKRATAAVSRTGDRRTRK